MKKINILLTNDDGFHAEGIQTLFNFLKDISRVTIIAPDRERSAVGHGITMHQPLRAAQIQINDSTHYLINGTPADCVKLGVEYLMKNNPPDIVISGINRGPNLGGDILYSGTVSAAVEGTFYKIPSLAASLSDYGQADFSPAAVFIRNNLNQLLELANKATLNLNFPALKTDGNYNGVRFTRLGVRLYQNVFEERIDPRGQSYYWMGGEPVQCIQDPDTDIQAVNDGFISITPLQLDLTDTNFLVNIGNNSFVI